MTKKLKTFLLVFLIAFNPVFVLAQDDEPVPLPALPGPFSDISDSDVNLILGGNAWAPIGDGAASCGDAGISPFLGGEDTQAIWDFLRSRGLSEEQAAGVMGNLQAESEFRPDAVNPSSGAFGIAQWLGGRLTRLRDYASARGLEVDSMQVQLDYLWYELTGESPSPGIEEAVSSIPGGYESAAYSDLTTRNTVDLAAASFAMLFERYQSANEYRAGGGTIPPQPGSEAAFQSAFNGAEGRRIDNARAIFEEFGGTFTGSVSCINIGEVVVGDTSDVPCEAGTDNGVQDGYAGGQLYQIRTCIVQGIEVNSQISGEFDRLMDDARLRGNNFAGGGFRTMRGQLDSRIRNCSAITGDDDPDMYTLPSGSCETPTAIPGFSNHQMGLAIDFICGGQFLRLDRPGTVACFNWLVANAASYGLFNLPSENWHWSIDGG